MARKNAGPKPAKATADDTATVEVTEEAKAAAASKAAEEATAAEAAKAKAESDAAAAAAAADAAPEAEKPSKGRVEVFDSVRPDGTPVTVTRNIDTGEQSVKEKK